MHIHVTACNSGQPTGILIIFCHPMLGNLTNRAPITDYKAFESPFSFQNISQKRLMGSCRNTVYFIKSIHESTHSGFYRSPKWW